MAKLKFDTLTPRRIQRYGWKRDSLDHRDLIFKPAVSKKKLPDSVDLRPQMPPVYDQLSLGSCTSQAIGAAIQFDDMKQGLPDTSPRSRLFIYYGERTIEGSVNQDAGAQIRDGIKVIASIGAPPETDWPYVISNFKVKPPAAAYTDASQHRAVKYHSVEQDASHIMSALAQGFPVIFGFNVFAEFESAAVAKSGTVPMPAANERPLGGHAVLIVGYDTAKGVFIVRNSWGEGFGIAGYFTLPIEYVISPSLCSDFWTITQEQ